MILPEICMYLCGQFSSSRSQVCMSDDAWSDIHELVSFIVRRGP